MPDDYREPCHQWHEQDEIRERIGDPHGVGGSVFLDAEEREATRHLTWTLINDPEAASLLSEVTRRRDAFLAREVREGL